MELKWREKLLGCSKMELQLRRRAPTHTADRCELESEHGLSPLAPREAWKILSHQGSLSMPWILATSHEAFLQCSLLQVSYEVAVAPAALLRPARPSLSTPRRIHCLRSVRVRWIVRRTRLQANGVAGIQVASNTLDGGRDTALLLLHSRGTLSVGPHALLLVHVWLRHVAVLTALHLLRLLRLLLRHDHLTVLVLLTAIGRRHVAAAGGVHVVAGIHWRLRVGRRRVLASSHGAICPLCGRCLGLRCLGPLLTQSLSLLLLLGARSR